MKKTVLRFALIVGFCFSTVGALAQYGGGYPGARYSGQVDMLADLLFNGGASTTGTGALVLATGPTITGLNLSSPFQLDAANFAERFTAGSTYNALYNPDQVNIAIQLGDSGDPRNYYKNTNHRFTNIAGTTIYADIAATGTSVFSMPFSLSGDISAAAWTTNGIRYKNVAATLTDTSSSGTVATAYTNAFGGSTIAASSATTYTNYFGTYFTAPIAGTNVTLTNKYALGADTAKITGATVAVGGLTVQTGFTATGLVTNASLANMANSTIKCRTTAGTGVPEDCTGAQVRTITENGETLLAVLTASGSATLENASVFTSSYDSYKVVLENIVPATDGDTLYMRVHSGGSYQATNYVTNSGTGKTQIEVNGAGAISNTATLGTSGTSYIYNTNSTGMKKYYLYTGLTTVQTTLALAAANGRGYWDGGTGAIDGIQFFMSSGNIATGTILIYGMRSAL